MFQNKTVLYLLQNFIQSRKVHIFRQNASHLLPIKINLHWMACVHTAPAALQQTEFYQKKKKICEFAHLILPSFKIYMMTLLLFLPPAYEVQTTQICENVQKKFFSESLCLRVVCAGCVIRVLGVDCG